MPYSFGRGSEVEIRLTREEDLARILEIYNQTIPSRQVTADLEPVTLKQKQQRFEEHQDSRQPLFVVEEQNVIAWFSISPFSDRLAYD